VRVCTCECVSKYFVHEPKQEDVLKCVTLACVHNMQMCANMWSGGGAPGWVCLCVHRL
jgi:hypothetical protein